MFPTIVIVMVFVVVFLFITIVILRARVINLSSAIDRKIQGPQYLELLACEERCLPRG